MKLVILINISKESTDKKQEVILNENEGNLSIEAMLKNELKEVKSQKNSQTQDVVSINTGIKGFKQYIILTCMCM